MAVKLMIESKNGVSGQIIKDSINREGIRLTTIHVRYPRMIHSELMTHRVFSRNGRSSRAVPVATLLKEDHYLPYFMKNKPGMVANEEMRPEEWLRANEVWNDLAAYTKEAVAELNELGVHKQWANRPLEAFGYIDVLISSTEWANFMALRDEDGAQPEIMAVAQLIKLLMDKSKPSLLEPDEWHLPYIDMEADLKAILEYKGVTDFSKLRREETLDTLRKISTARCARLTIRPFDGDSSIEKEVTRFERLMISRPVHASPAEHIATPDTLGLIGGGLKQYLNKHEHGNFYGWRQFRKQIPFNTVY